MIVEIQRWILEENVEPFLIVLGWIVEYEFDEADADGIMPTLARTDAEADKWCDYEFDGKNSCKFKLAKDVGSSVVLVRLEVAQDIESKVRLAIEIFSTFRVNR